MSIKPSGTWLKSREAAKLPFRQGAKPRAEPDSVTEAPSSEHAPKTAKVLELMLLTKSLAAGVTITRVGRRVSFFRVKDRGAEKLPALSEWSTDKETAPSLTAVRPSFTDQRPPAQTAAALSEPETATGLPSSEQEPPTTKAPTFTELTRLTRTAPGPSPIRGAIVTVGWATFFCKCKAACAELPAWSSRLAVTVSRPSSSPERSRAACQVPPAHWALLGALVVAVVEVAVRLTPPPSSEHLPPRMKPLTVWALTKELSAGRSKLKEGALVSFTSDRLMLSEGLPALSSTEMETVTVPSASGDRSRVRLQEPSLQVVEDDTPPPASTSTEAPSTGHWPERGRAFTSAAFKTAGAPPWPGATPPSGAATETLWPLPVGA